MDYHALANDVVDETLKCELCCCILLRMGSRFTSSPQGRESSIKKGADFAFAFYGYRVYPLDEAYLFALRGAILCVASRKGTEPFSANAVHLEPYRYWRACSRIRTNAILRACKAMPKDWENSACMQNREYRAFGLSSPALLQNEPAQAYGHGNGPAIKTQTAERAYLHAA